MIASLSQPLLPASTKPEENPSCWREKNMACNGLHPRVAVVAIVSDDQGRVVAGRRIGPLGSGQWAFPGGHLDQGEDLLACVERETLEETGLVVRGVRTVGITNDKFVEAGKHYVTVFVKCERRDPGQEPQRLEPNKCEGWSWKTWDELRAMVDDENGSKELFLPVVNLLRDNPRVEQLLA